MRDFVVIGLTGPTGSGKSTFSGFLQKHGCAVIDADALARQATAPKAACVQLLAGAFGEDIKTPEGGIDRALLASRAFADRESTALLNGIVHPWVFLETLAQINRYRRENRRLIVFDAPVLFESNADALCDLVVSVIAPQEVRIQRIMNRDSLTRQQALQRLSAQQPESYYRRQSDIVIDGTEEYTHLEQEAVQVVAPLREKLGGVYG